MRKLLVLTDFDSMGSGYKHIAVPLYTKMAEMGYDIKIIGLQYHKEEHNHPFSVLPAQTVQEVHTIASNMVQLWNPDVVIVAFDLPHHEQFRRTLAPFKKKYMAIVPLENGPLCMTWAVPLFDMDGVFFISELGKQEALKVGVKAEHLQIGVDTVSWRPASSEEKSKLRDGLGIAQDAFVVLTVADNQERKNLWAGMDAISRLKKEITRPIKYILVTREQNPYGYKLRDLAVSLGINQEYTPFERGMPQKDLWALYAIADVYLQPSKAEGLGLPVLDAMCCKIPVIATKTGAMVELLDKGRGFLVTPEYEITDVWGNSLRHFIDRQLVADYLHIVSIHQNDDSSVNRAYKYVSKRTWDIPAKQLHDKITEILDEPKTEKTTN